MGAKEPVRSESFSFRLKVNKLVETKLVDSYDKSVTDIDRNSEELASIDIAGTNWQDLKEKLHGHIDLI